MYCRNCGNEIQDTARFCPKCGAQQEPASGPDTPAGPPGAQAQPSAARPPAQSPPPQQYQPPPAGTQPAQGAGAGYGAAPGGFELRPLGFGEIFDRGLKLYMRYFKYILGTAAVVMVPFYMMSFILQALQLMPVASGGDMPFGLSVVGLLAMAPLFIVLLLLIPVQQGATIRIVSDIYMGNAPSIRTAYSAALGNAGKLVLTALLYGLIVMAGMILCVIPGIYFSVALVLYPYIIMLEDRGITDSLKRSREMIAGVWFKLFLLLFIVGGITSIVTSIVRVPYQLFLASGTEALIAAPFIDFAANMIGLLVYPLGTVITILFYYDLRVRREGFDLDMMSREIMK